MLFQAMGQRLVVISNLETALELLEKRSAIYSSRPRSVLYDLYVAKSDQTGFLLP